MTFHFFTFFLVMYLKNKKEMELSILAQYIYIYIALLYSTKGMFMNTLRIQLATFHWKENQ